MEKLDLEANRNVALQQEKMTATELKWYSDLKNELKKYKIPVEDVAEFAKVVNGIKQQGYDLGKVLSEFSDIDSLVTRHKMLLNSMKMLESKCTNLEQESSILENAVNFHKQTITKYNELEAIGFGLKELKALWYTINEIAIANNISMKEAPRKFFKDVEEQYDNKLGFESKVESLRLEVNRLSHELNRIRAGLFAQPLVGSALIRLIQSGVKEQDIINITSIFESHSETINPQLLIAELKEYGNIKSNIQKLRNQVDSLQTQKQDLDVYNNQSIVSTYMYSKQSIYFYSRVIDLLKNEIIGLFSALIFIKNYYLPNLHLENLKKSNDLGPVIPLIRAAKGESVSILELKASVIKAIEIMINKLNTNDGVAKILSDARFALEKKQ